MGALRVAKKTKTKAAKVENGETPVKRGLSRKIKILAGCATLFAVVSGSGGAYLLMHAPAAHAEEAAEAATPSIPVPMPVERVASATPLKASDYQIVSIFQNEAIVATRNNLVRLKIGSSAPGIGTVQAIQAGENGGGAIIGTDATLKSL